MVALQVDEWLQERPPAPDLVRTLRCVWRGDLRDFRTPLPDECMDVTWIDDGTLWLSGPESRSWSPEEPTGSTAVGVRFEPGTGPAVLGVAASEVRDARVALGGCGVTATCGSWPNGWRSNPTTTHGCGCWNVPSVV